MLDVNEKWEIEISNEDIGKTQIISGSDQFIVKSKAKALENHWEKVSLSLTKEDREIIEFKKSLNQIHSYSSKPRVVRWLTKYIISEVSNLLKGTLYVDDVIDWDSLIDRAPFDVKLPEKKPNASLQDIKLKYPNSDDSQLKSLLADENERIKLENEFSTFQWQTKKDWYLHKQAEYNKSLMSLRDRYFSQDPEVILEYCDIVLTNSDYPSYFPYKWHLDYKTDSQTLLINYQLPSSDDLQLPPSLLNEFNTSISAIIESLCTQVALRTIHEVFESDQANAITEVIFNGLHKDKCSVSVSVAKDRFENLDLYSGDEKELLKNIGGKTCKFGSLKIRSFDVLEVSNSKVDDVTEANEQGRLNSLCLADFHFNVEIIEEKMQTLSFFEVSSSKGLPVVKLNVEHPAYVLYKRDEQNNEFLSALLSSWAYMENECSLNRREQLEVARSRWGEMLGDILIGE